jgi:hypothetical protein
MGDCFVMFDNVNSYLVIAIAIVNYLVIVYVNHLATTRAQIIVNANIGS